MLTFQEFFDGYGESLLEGWLRAREDGNDEEFTYWTLGEYDTYTDAELECPECSSLMEEDGICEHCGEAVIAIERDYEVPYHGLLDSRSKAEEFLDLHHRIEEVA
jgi:hypothetical protein